MRNVEVSSIIKNFYKRRLQIYEKSLSRWDE